VPASIADRVPKLGDWNGGSAWFVDDDLRPVPFPESAVTGSGYRQRSKTDQAVSFDEVMPALHDPAERIKAQNADSVTAEVLYSFPYLWDAIKQLDDAEVRLACARAYNDWIAEYCAHDPARLIGVAKIPTSSIEDAAKELARCVGELNLKGAVIDAWPDDSNGPADAALDPMWDVANQAGIPLSLHYGLGDARSAPTAAIAAGNKPPAANAVLPLVASGVFDRHPNLRMVFAHTDAGWAFHWMEFGDNMYLRQRHLQHFKLERDDVFPSDYTRRHFWFTIQQDRSALRLRHILNSEHLMWASHFPLDAADWPDNRTHAVQVAAELPPDEQQNFLAGNVSRLYRLPGFEEGAEIPPFDAVEQLVYF
jgi:predicted TIM-barrel fold metal-dependent hydrolase